MTPERINVTDNAGNTPVHVAAKYNRVRSLAVLLKFKAGDCEVSVSNCHIFFFFLQNDLCKVVGIMTG